MAHLIVSAQIEGDILVCPEGLSFWGGVDPASGCIIDAHHALHGQSLAGRIVLMPTSCGSCSGGGVLLELALDGHAPAALIFCEDEGILTPGAVIASAMFERSVGIIHMTTDNLGAGFEIAERGELCHQARLRNHPARLKLILSDKAAQIDPCANGANGMDPTAFGRQSFKEQFWESV